MKYLFALLLVLTAVVTFAQEQKVFVFETRDGQLFTRRQKDSLCYRANQYVGTKIVKIADDTIFYSLVYFDKKQAPVRYQNEGVFCGNDDRLGLNDIIKKYPFNKTIKIKLVSFKLEETSHAERQIPKTNGVVDFTKMFEVKTLDSKSADKLKDVLYNFKQGNGPTEKFMCYEPRNGIVFLDDADKVIGYIELCFECRGSKMEPVDMNIGRFCEEKFDAIQGLFISSGITYGMERDAD
ncbi:MAG TPA: hypothetical protein VL443_00575 [Cyclobacteriaceae bacterium]|jgi:hypothetical protein|nr:hypothetical protein [Cyclobacteriaceae bacterium]